MNELTSPPVDRDAAAATPLRTMPHNLRAELAVLGAILVNNELYHRIADLLRPEDFYEPVHRRIFEVCAETIQKGQLADHTTLTLATVGPDGEPQAADLYYAETDDLTLYFVSATDSRHAANVARDPRVAVTIHATSAHWREIRGLQMEGLCHRVTGGERTRAWARYTAKFPFVLTDPALFRALSRAALYRITPHWLRWIDNRAGLGHRQEWTRAGDRWTAITHNPGGTR